MMRYRNKGVEKSLRSDMVECTEQMFEALPDDNKDLSELKRRLCPNMKELQNFLMVKGLYSDPYKRISFSLEVDLCNKTLDSKCANIEDIDELLNSGL